jgi:hypothetical protein
MICYSPSSSEAIYIKNACLYLLNETESASETWSCFSRTCHGRECRQQHHWYIYEYHPNHSMVNATATNHSTQCFACCASHRLPTYSPVDGRVLSVSYMGTMNIVSTCMEHRSSYTFRAPNTHLVLVIGHFCSVLLMS